MEFPELPNPYSSPQLISRHENRVVLRAWSAEAGEHVVLKCLLPPFREGEGEGFRQEFLHLEALDHPNWVRPDHFGYFAEGGMWFSLELSKGVPLSEFPIRGWTPELLEISRQILSGLNALHLRGVAQLDLKPEQILVSWQGEGTLGWAGENEGGIGSSIQVHLLDLGLASEFSGIVGVAGTPGYLAPELLSGEGSWDERADLYAFGCVLFEAVTGSPLFQGIDGRDVLRTQAAGVSIRARVAECGFDVTQIASAQALPSILIDLMEDLVVRNPTRRIRDAIDAWFRLRDVAGAGLTERPLLNDSRSFPFCGREDEVGTFVTWLERAETSGVTGTRDCILRGEIGIGKSRLTRRLRSVAATRGWSIDGVLVRHANEDITVAFRHETLFVSTPEFVDGTPPNERTLIIDVRPLSRTVLEKLARAAGAERGILSEYLVECSLGNPHLMLHLLGRVPSELLIGTGSFSRREIVSFFDLAPPPKQWHEWQDLFLAELDAADREQLFRFCLGNLGVGTIEDEEHTVTKETLGLSWRDRFSSLTRKAENDAAEMGTGPRSTGLPRIWARALLSRFGAGESALVSDFVAEVNTEGTLRGEELESHARVLAILGLWPNPLLEPAIMWMSEFGRPGHISALFEEAVRSATKQPSLDCLSYEALTNLLYGKSVGFDLVWRDGALFRDREDALAGIAPEQAALFAFLDAYTESQSDAAIGFLQNVDVPPSEALATVWSHAYSAALLRTRRERELPDLWDRVAGAHAMSSESFQNWIALGRADQLAPGEARVALERLCESGERLPDWLRGPVLARLGQLQIGSRDHVRAEVALQEARSCFERVGSRQLDTVDADLTAILYANGDIRSVLEQCKLSFRRDVIRGAWSRALTFLFNWILVASEVGQFQDCLSFLKSGWRFRVGDIHAHHEIGLRALEAIVRVRVGRSNGIDALFRPGVDPPKRRAQHQICIAHHEYLRGDRVGATERFEGALEHFSGAEASDDRAEHVSYWLRLLCDAGDRTRCVETYSRLGAKSFPSANFGTKRLLIAIQCEMCLEGWLAGPSVELLLEQSLEAQRALDDIGFAPQAWKLSWRLASFLARRGDMEGSRAFEADASDRLGILCHGLRHSEDVELFQQLPGPRAFLLAQSGPASEF